VVESYSFGVSKENYEHIDLPSLMMKEERRKNASKKDQSAEQSSSIEEL